MSVAVTHSSEKNVAAKYVQTKRFFRPRRFLWSVEKYHHAIEAGIFDEEAHIELLDGEIIETMPEKPPHVTALKLVSIVLAQTFHLMDAHISSQHPVTVPPHSEPEPDVAVLRGGVRAYATQHPQPDDVLLLVEVSVSTLASDRTIKARIYARAKIAEYWILNVSARTLEVYRNPQNGVYPAPVIYDETMHVLPLNAPPSAASIAVSDLLP